MGQAGGAAGQLCAEVGGQVLHEVVGQGGGQQERQCGDDEEHRNEGGDRGGGVPQQRAQRERCSGSSGVGPALDGVAGSQVQLSDGTTVPADAAYLTKSIDDPDAQVVKGFDKGVMASTIRPGSVSAQDTAALVAYVQSIK